MSWLGFAASLAWREARASHRRLLLLAATVMAGVGALVAINSFTDNIRVSVAEQAQALLGGDLALRSRASVDTATIATALLDSLSGVGGDSVRIARSASFVAMAYLPRGGAARLVQVRTVDPGWPYHGTIVTQPAGSWHRLQDGAMLVDPSLLTSLDAQVGDTLMLGEARFPVAGTVSNVPGEVGIQAAFGARVFIAHGRLEDTRLLGFGARVEHTTYLALPRSIDPQNVAEAWRDTLRSSRVSIRTVADDRDDLTRDLTNLGRFLGMVALAALLLGGLGTASAVHVLIRQRLDSIAVLRCLGATSGQLIAAYLLQAVAMALLGSLAGAWLGVMLQQLLPRVLADFLPVDVRVVPSLSAMALGVGLGVWTAAAFALMPMLGIRSVAPLATLRRNTDPPRTRWDLPRILVAAALGASVLGLAVAQGGSWQMGRNFTLGIAVALLVLWVVSLLLIRTARRFTPMISPYLVRQGGGARQPAPPRQPDHHRGAGAGVRGVPAHHAVRGAGQPPARSPGRFGTGSPQHGADRHPARSARPRQPGDHRGGRQLAGTGADRADEDRRGQRPGCGPDHRHRQDRAWRQPG
ncbi:MAG TPA: ABC transporter permease [Gemmatimonadales bacterium]|nr:ABC transporter permease [Gemmatimonadales bacterium]